MNILYGAIKETNILQQQKFVTNDYIQRKVILAKLPMNKPETNHLNKSIKHLTYVTDQNIRKIGLKLERECEPC